MFRAGVSMPTESSPDKIASALVELLAQPQFREAAERAAAAIVADTPDKTAAAALSVSPISPDRLIPLRVHDLET
jgi:UDP:flavonoid glycosyltransferase YjiC (YdhE family)